MILLVCLVDASIDHPRVGLYKLIDDGSQRLTKLTLSTSAPFDDEKDHLPY